MSRFVVDSLVAHFNAPLDIRQVPVATKSDLLNYEQRDCYDGLSIFCEEDDQFYVYDADFTNDKTGHFKPIGSAIRWVDSLPDFADAQDDIFYGIWENRQPVGAFKINPDYAGSVILRGDNRGVNYGGSFFSWKTISEDASYQKWFLRVDRNATGPDIVYGYDADSEYYEFNLFSNGLLEPVLYFLAKEDDDTMHWERNHLSSRIGKSLKSVIWTDRLYNFEQDGDNPNQLYYLREDTLEKPNPTAQAKVFKKGLYMYDNYTDEYFMVGGSPIDELTVLENYEGKLETSVGGYYEDWFETEEITKNIVAATSSVSIPFASSHTISDGCGIRVTLVNNTTQEVFTTRGLVSNGEYFDKGMFAGNKVKVTCTTTGLMLEEVDGTNVFTPGEYTIYTYGGKYRRKSDANFVAIDNKTIVIDENGELVAYPIIDVPDNGVFDDIPEEERLPNNIYRTSRDVYVFEGRFKLDSSKTDAGWTMDETGVMEVIDPDTGETVFHDWIEINLDWDKRKPTGDDPWFVGDADNGDLYACTFDDVHYLDYGEEHSHEDKIMLAMWYQSLNEIVPSWHIIYNSLSREADGQLYINNVLLQDNKTTTQLKITVNCTQAEYDAWSDAGQINPETSYYIIDGEYDVVNGNYINLANKPSLEGVELRSGLTYEDLGLISKQEVEQLLTGMFIYQGSVDYFSDLPISPKNKKGDVYFVVNDDPGDPPAHVMGQYAWSGSKWDFIGTMDVDMSQYQKKEDLTLNTVEKNVVPAINELLASIGTLDELETEEKENLVKAINEVLRKRVIIDVLADVGTSGTLNPQQVSYLKSNVVACILQGGVRMQRTGVDGITLIYSTVRKKHEDEEEAGYRYQYIRVNSETGEWVGDIDIISGGEGGNISVWSSTKSYESGEQVYQYDPNYDTYNYYSSKIDDNLGHPPLEDTEKAFWIPCTNEVTHTQYKVLPEASLLYLDRIFQYIGETNTYYTNGRFYKCIKEEAGGETTYKWDEVSVGGEETELVAETWRFTLTDGTTQEVIVYVDPNETEDVWTFTTESGETFTRSVRIKQ